jgi:eukaryotic-like serine/threonine-protein kinase
MTLPSDRWHLTETIFHETVGLSEPERTLVLESRCDGDATLLVELRALLAACEAEQSHNAGTASSNEVPLLRVGPYVLDRLLGRGGMGTVYLAHRADGQFEQRVAIKVIDLPLASNLFRERFRAERQILASLNHPYITRLLDGGVRDSGELYLVMEYVEGVSITEFANLHNLSLPARLELFCKVCEAVQFAHQNLIVHRDLKPDNILVVADMTPRLLDFGTAKIVATPDSSQADRADLTRAGMQIFTPRYASPEQILEQNITIATDIYSLGVLLFVLLTGEHPYEFSEFTNKEMVRVITQQPPNRPSAVNPRLNSDLDSIVLKALRKDPRERYTTVEQFSIDIQAYLDHRPVQARRGTFRYLAGKFVRRNKLALSGASLLLLSLVAGTIGIQRQARVAERQRKKAEARSDDLRTLSNSLLSELDDAIKMLPGSTPAQKLIINGMLHYLDRLVQDGGDDKATQLDAANAYRRVGNLQGNPYDQNLGDPSGGLRNIQKASVIVSRLMASQPNDIAVLTSYAQVEGSRGELLLGLSRLPEAIEAQRHACDTFSKLAQLPDASSQQASEAATACGALGDVLGQPGRLNVGDVDGALKAYQQAFALQKLALRLDPTSARAIRGIPVALYKLGNLQIGNHPAEAVNQYRQAIHEIDKLPSSSQTPSLLYIRASVLRRLGSALDDVQDPAGGLALLEQARSFLAARVVADPEDNHAKVDLSVALENIAECYEDLADPHLHPENSNRQADRKLAMQTLQESIALTDILSKQNPSDLVLKASVAAQRVRLGMLQQGSPQAAQGLKTASRGLAELRVLADQPSASPFVLDQACASLLEVEKTPLRDPSTLLSYALRNVKAIPSNVPYQLTLAWAYRAASQPDQARTIARNALSALPPSLPGQAETRTHRWLTIEAEK